MYIGNADNFNVKSISKRAFSKAVISDFMKKHEQLREASENAVMNGGKLYAIFSGKECVGVYAFVLVKNYFAKFAEQNSVDKFIYGNNKDAMRLDGVFLSDDAEKSRKKIEDIIVAEMREKIEFGMLCGVEWGEKIFVRKTIKVNIPTSESDKIMYFIIGCLTILCITQSLKAAFLIGLAYYFMFGNTVTVEKSKWCGISQEGDAEKCL